MRPQRGVALLMVISTIAILLTAVYDFSFNTDVQYSLALNERDRLQAEYLAYSAIQLMQLELQLEKSAKSLLANVPSGMAKGMGGPLCQKFPMSSSLMRGIFSGTLTGEGGGEGGEGAGEGGEQKAAPKGDGPMISSFQQDAAESFLDFRGDFDGQCADIQSRMNLNFFFDLDPAQQSIGSVNAYDQYKLAVMAAVKPTDKEKPTPMPDEIKNGVRNLADWVDKNDQINELGGIVAGPEESLYRGEANYKVKNGKMLSIDEVYLVKDVDDAWFNPVKDFFTVYGDNHVNVCNADEVLTMALITRYVAANQRFSSVDVNKPEMKTKLMSAIALNCEGTQPQAAKIGQDVDTVLGGGTVGAAPATGTQPAQTTTPPATTTTPGTQAPSTAVASTFSQMITTEARWYELKSTGQVGNVVVHLTQVIDTKESDPKQWKLLFSKME